MDGSHLDGFVASKDKEVAESTAILSAEEK